MDQLLASLTDISLKDLVSPALVFVGLLLNGWYFSKRTEKYKAAAAVYSESEKDIGRLRREAFFRLSNAESISFSGCRRIISASEHPNKHAMIDALLPGLTQLWQGIRAIEAENVNIHLSRADLEPFIKLARGFGDFFFLLDNKNYGKEAYVKNLKAELAELAKQRTEAREHVRRSLAIKI